MSIAANVGTKYFYAPEGTILRIRDEQGQVCFEGVAIATGLFTGRFYIPIPMEMALAGRIVRIEGREGKCDALCLQSCDSLEHLPLVRACPLRAS